MNKTTPVETNENIDAANNRRKSKVEPAAADARMKTTMEGKQTGEHKKLITMDQSRVKAFTSEDKG